MSLRRQKVEVFWGSFLDVPFPLGSSVYVCNGKSVTRASGEKPMLKRSLNPDAALLANRGWCPGRKDRKPLGCTSYIRRACGREQQGFRFPDPREDLESRSLNGGSYKVPLVV